MALCMVTDSTSYLPHDIREQYGITVVPLSVDLDGVEYVEDTPEAEGFYRALAASKSFPTSSQPAVSVLVEAFEGPASRGDAVVGVFLSSEMSGTHSTALLARDMVKERYPDAVIEVVDSRSNCMELGFATLAGCRAAEAGGSTAEVVAAVRAMIERTRFLFVPDTLEYLRRGGRMGGAQALLGTLLQIRPILTVADGKTEVFSKVRTKRKALAEIVAAFKADIESKGFVDAIVHHIDDEEEGTELARMVESVTGVMPRVIGLGPVIGTHVGPSTAGLVYATDKEMHKSARKEQP
jgi:DegV family protein with EDD domain